MYCEYNILLKCVSKLLANPINISQKNNAKIIEICKECNAPHPDIEHFLAGLKDKVIALWGSYRNSMVRVDYSDKYVRTAYMLAYYPYYINPVYEVLNSIKYAFNDNCIKIGFLGGGALPELLGFTKYISKYDSNIRSLYATIFDATPHWITEREHCTVPLVKKYFNNEIKLHSVTINLWDQNFKLEKELFEDLDIVILQNCINEASNCEKIALKKNLEAIWKELKSNTLLIIVDLDYEKNGNFISNFVNDIKTKKVIKPLDKISINSSLPKCYFIQEMLFDPNESGLYPRSGQRNYWNLVLKKIG